MPQHEVLYLVPTWILGVVLLVACIAASELGYRVGRARRIAGAVDDSLTTVEAAMLGLLALLIAFTYSIASTRYETRKQFVLDETTAISAAIVQAGLDPSPHAAQVASILREYVDVRLEFFFAGADMSRIDRAEREANRLVAEAWATVKRMTTESPPTDLTQTLVQSLSDVMSLNTKRLAAMRDHVPEPMIFLMMLVSVAAFGLVGNSIGNKGRRSFWTSFSIPLIVVACIALTIDLDRPRRGIVNVSQKPLLDLKESLQAR